MGSSGRKRLPHHLSSFLFLTTHHPSSSAFVRIPHQNPNSLTYLTKSYPLRGVRLVSFPPLTTAPLPFLPFFSLFLAFFLCVSSFAPRCVSFLLSSPLLSSSPLVLLLSTPAHSPALQLALFVISVLPTLPCCPVSLALSCRALRCLVPPTLVQLTSLSPSLSLSLSRSRSCSQYRNGTDGIVSAVSTAWELRMLSVPSTEH